MRHTRQQLTNPRPGHGDRRFVVSYFLEDDTVGIFEEKIRNLGFWQGKFLDRSKPLDKEYRPLFTPASFYVGATVSVYGHSFNLMKADEYTLRYMEGRPEEYPCANIKLILGRIREKIKQCVNICHPEVSALVTE